jgi:TatD DNase family protein
MELIETHAHLNDAAFDADRDAVLDRARAAGVTRLVEIADSPADWDRAVALARARPFVRASLGLHPYYADQYSLELLAKLEKKAKLPEVCAIGEIGLDYVKTQIPVDVQKTAFETLLAAARDWGVPSVIHCRGAYPDLLEILRKHFPAPPTDKRFWGVVHCFSGTAPEAVECVKLGFALGCDGPITYPKNDPLREAFKQVGPSVTVLETDSPYLPPQSLRGKRNEPANLHEIIAKLAQAWAIPLSEAAAATSRNAVDLYRLEG